MSIEDLIGKEIWKSFVGSVDSSFAPMLLINNLKTQSQLRIGFIDSRRGWWAASKSSLKIGSGVTLLENFLIWRASSTLQSL